MPNPVLRPSLECDAEFLYLTAESCFRPIIEVLGRKWSTARMQEKCRHDALSGMTSIIEVEGRTAGYFIVERRPDEFWLDALVLAPDFQRQGIGATIVSGLRREARSLQVPIRLGVLVGNPAQTFWKQHGFEVIGAVDAQHLLMERAP